MATEARYALYFVPGPDTDLYRFGRAALAYDCYTGEDVAPLTDASVSASEWTALTAEPRGYGFHATMKAPFHLRPECREEDLGDALRRFAAARDARPTFAPVIAELGSFVAIVPREKSPALDALAADCVRAFDRFRAPLTREDRARRLRARLTADEVENLDRWGYPYVFAQFRFHMSLTGPVDEEDRIAILLALRKNFAAWHGDGAVVVDRLALVRQDRRAGRFRVVCDAPIAAAG